MKRELEQRLCKLEVAQRQLMDEFNARQEVLKEQQYILKTASTSNFYRSLQNKLQQVFLGCKVVSKGIPSDVSSSSSATSAAAAAGGTAVVLQYVDIAGNTLLLPPAYFNLGVTAASSLTVSMRELDEVTETVARRLALMYGEQLNFLSSESAWLLGECLQGDWHSL